MPEEEEEEEVCCTLTPFSTGGQMLQFIVLLSLLKQLFKYKHFCAVL
jgi:hypothetical protein